ncbi:diacylglycerol kinase family protein [Acaryochloris marina]|uniref:Diacylglycerol kinase n=1 Tax=Acaryochloris marina (strain MBIC 11017) TaxID=329726 RepID=B0C7R8_ACAM1|nr:diacylglycerol kinase family protein [Acaryochloris marina]ABW26459.1 diacylglycerol kinase [Acaryochloris marina MBIC11017]
MSNKSIISSQSSTEPEPARLKRELSFKVAHNLFVSFKYAWAGLSYTFQTQRNFRIHTVIGSVALSMGLSLQLEPVELAVIALTSGLVLVMELLNTALEAVVDLTVERTYHELAKIAKDCAAAAVLVSAMAAVVIAAFLIIPPFLALFQA